MKISNEVKVGLIAVAGIASLFLGYNFLKGKRLFSDDTMLIGMYGNVQGLAPSNPIIINGLQVGTVYKISTDKDMRRIAVEMNITKNINIGKNSVAVIKPNPIGTTSIEIKLGDSPELLHNRDTIFTDANAGLFEDVLKKVDPVLFEVKKAVSSLDSLIININSVVDPNSKKNIQSTLNNLNVITASMSQSALSLQSLLNQQTGLVTKTMRNLESVTSNLAENNPKINSVMTNLDEATSKLAKIELQKTMDSLDYAVNQIKRLTEKFNSNSGSLGLLLNDTRLYNNLASTGNKLNLLLDDIRVNPKRYLSISVFGRKTSKEPLMLPLPDTVNSPYIIKKVGD